MLRAGYGRSADGLADQLVDVERLQVEPELAGLQPVEVEHLGDHPVQSLGLVVDLTGERLDLTVPISCSRMSSLKPWIPTSAVRNSWLTIETNSLLSRFSFSSCARLATAVSSASRLAVTSSNVARK